jgi:hypothetical protein
MSDHPAPCERGAQATLVDALLSRRSRRFGLGMHLNAGPLAYQSTRSPQPLSREEEALLAFAACGITGYALAELPYQAGDRPEAGSGNIMTHVVGRTAPSGDAIHNCTVFVLNDQGTGLLRRPQDFPRTEIPALVQAAHGRQFVELLRAEPGAHRRPSRRSPAAVAVRVTRQPVFGQCPGLDLLPSGGRSHGPLHQRDAVLLRWRLRDVRGR